MENTRSAEMELLGRVGEDRTELPQLLDREADGSLIAHGNLKANTIAKQYRRRIVLPKKGIRSKAQITHTKDPEILVLLKLARGVTT
jgi:hypothetical protein